MKKAVVIGAGFGGLCSAALLAKQGYSVTLLEKNESAGGRGRMFSDNGFNFDMGPSWYLMPDVFEAFFAEFGKKPEDYYSLQRLDPSYKLFFGDGEPIEISADLHKNYELFDRLEKNGAAKLKRYLKEAEYKYRVAMESFLYKEYRTVLDFFSWRMITEGWRLQVFKNLARYAEQFFESDKARKIVEYSIVFLGGTPSSTPALYSLISHVDLTMGVFYPTGGMNAVARGLEKLCKEQGVTLVYDCPVDSIKTSSGKAVGVQAGGKLYDAEVIISNADYKHTELQLLEEQDRTYSKKYWDKVTVAPSGLILYLGVDKKVNGLQHHNLILDNDWQRHFRQIFDNPGWPKHPSYYVCCPSKTDTTVAPKGKENLFFLMPVASGLDDTDEIREEYYDFLIDHLEKTLGTSFKQDVISSRVYSHRDFISDYHSIKGTALGLAHTLMQTANFRPQQRSKKVKGLFYVGHNTHPGIGVPMCFIGAQVICQNIQKERV